jgi:predicted transcriptional regulator
MSKASICWGHFGRICDRSHFSSTRGRCLRPIIVSVRPKWSQLIRSGAKTIELRRRFPKLPKGTAAYLYESSPTSCLTSLLNLGDIHELPVSELWHLHGAASCVHEVYFSEYFGNRSVGFGIEIAGCQRLPNPLPLIALRSKFGFSAPQSWAYASPDLISAIGSMG